MGRAPRNTSLLNAFSVITSVRRYLHNLHKVHNFFIARTPNKYMTCAVHIKPFAKDAQ
jgi:hypothetical protein